MIFRNANCSPADIILTDAIDLSISRSALGAPHASAPRGPLIIATAPHGPLALPLSAALLAASVLIDLDAPIEVESRVNDDFLEEVRERVFAGGLRPHLWLKILARLVTEVARTEERSDRDMLFTLIDSCVVKPFLAATGVAASN